VIRVPCRRSKVPGSPYNEAVQLREALRAAVTKLEAAKIEQPRLQAEVLALHVLHCDRAYLFAHPERELTREQQSQYEQLVARRAAGEPLQYITGHQEFWKADFLVTPAVLIPRPETEHLMEAVLELVRGMAPSPHLPEEGKCGPPGPRGGALNPRLKLIDVGTGSGAIAVTLARELPEAEVHAVDLSPEALKVARRNAERLGAHVHFVQSDLLAAVTRDASFDFVVSNPPYVALNDAELQEVVRRHEPPLALFAGEDGLDVIRRLIPQAHEALRPGGWLLMEIGFGQADAVQQLLGSWQDVHTAADLAGIARVVIARKPG
jgi:release factor glutamine methyltransferase